MTQAQCKAARRKNQLRYRGRHSHISIGEAVERERQRAMRQQAVSRKKKS